MALKKIKGDDCHICMWAECTEHNADVDADGLPMWTKCTWGWRTYANEPCANVATMAAIHNFSLPDFDNWLRDFPECPARGELLEYRRRLVSAVESNNHEAAGAYMRLLLGERLAAMREGFLFPPAQTGRKVRAPFSVANKKRSGETQAKRAEWQKKACALWAKPQHANKSATDIARLIDAMHWNTVRRHIRHPEG